MRETASAIGSRVEDLQRQQLVLVLVHKALELARGLLRLLLIEAA